MNDPPAYKFEALESHKTAIQRQLTEALNIESENPDCIINGRGEYGNNRIPRLKLTIENEIYNANPSHPQIAPPAGASSSLAEQPPDHSSNAQCNPSDSFSQQFSQRKRKAKQEALNSTEKQACRPSMLPSKSQKVLDTNVGNPVLEGSQEGIRQSFEMSFDNRMQKNRSKRPVNTRKNYTNRLQRSQKEG